MLLISDLHLDQNRQDITQTLIDFLKGRAIGCGQLYILGDLFEVWIGDDAPNPLAELVAAQLKSVSDKGVEIFLMHGNRDFLIGENFAQRCGASLIQEPYLIDTGSQKIALLHGDSLCTRDIEYMKFRKLVRNPDWQQDFLSKSLAERRAIASQAREQSKQTTRAAASDIMDVTNAAVTGLMQELQVDKLIHGHTHRPAIHKVDFDKPVISKSDGTRVVLGDWDQRGWYAEITDHDITLNHFPLAG